MDEQGVHLELSDLPINIALLLERYLSIEHPDQDIIIHRGPLSIFGLLPPETQGNVLRSKKETRPSALLTTKAINKYTSKDYYENECQKPITILEIDKEIELSLVVDDAQFSDDDIDYTILKPGDELYHSSVTAIYNTVDNNLYIYLLHFKNPYYIGVKCEHEDDNDNIYYIDYEGVNAEDFSNLDDEGVDFSIFRNLDYGNVDFSNLGSGPNTKQEIMTNIKQGTFTIDPFSEYNIRCRRLSCVSYDPNYAKGYLVNWYNTIVSPDIDYTITYEVLKLIVILDWLARNCFQFLAYELYDSHIIESEYDLRDPDIRNQLLPVFEYSRKIIREYIIQLTGAIL